MGTTEDTFQLNFLNCFHNRKDIFFLAGRLFCLLDFSQSFFFSFIVFVHYIVLQSPVALQPSDFYSPLKKRPGSKRVYTQAFVFVFTRVFLFTELRKIQVM